MPSVTFSTYCHPPHLPKLHKEGVLENIIATHNYPFDEIIVVHQRCKGLEYRPFGISVRLLETEDYYPQIFAEYGIKWPDPVADEWTHGPGAAHFWEAHCMNHLIVGKEAHSEYIVFSDCDCRMIKNGPPSWIEIGIKELQRSQSNILISPSDGGGERSTQNMSQQLFMMRKDAFMELDWRQPWNGKFDAPGGPFQEYYHLIEGRIGRHLTSHNKYRKVLSDNWRYWHDGNDWNP